MNYKERLAMSNKAHEKRIKLLDSRIKPNIDDKYRHNLYQLIRYHRDVLEGQYLTGKIANKNLKKKIYKYYFNY